jgi:hypothetical protein
MSANTYVTVVGATILMAIIIGVCMSKYVAINTIKENFMQNMIKIENGIVPYPLEGMIYYVETNEESDDTWIANKPIQYIDEEGYHCGWGLATLCFKFKDLGEVYFFSREEAKVNLGCEDKQL